MTHPPTPTPIQAAREYPPEDKLGQVYLNNCLHAVKYKNATATHCLYKNYSPNDWFPCTGTPVPVAARGKEDPEPDSRLLQEVPERKTERERERATLHVWIQRLFATELDCEIVDQIN